MGVERSPISQAKKLLRSQIKTKLLSVHQDQLHEQSHQVLKVLRTLQPYKDATKIAFYMNMPTSEVKTIPLIKQAFEDNKRVFLPRITRLSQNHELQRFSKQKSKLEMLEITNYELLQKLTPVGPFKLLEPQSGIDALSNELKGLDLIIMPGVAFTSTCYRMGHGAGFYDDYVKRHVEAGFAKPTLIGIGLQEQLVASLPTEDHDEILDGVIIADQYYKGQF